MGRTVADNWSPAFRARRWERDRAQFAAWMDGAAVRSPWKRRRFGIWREEQFSDKMRVARDVERQRRAELVANPSPELVAAYQELRAAEAASGAQLGCARGGDMTDPETVRLLARLLSDHAEKFR
ncbi:hypothetical protein [Rhodococcus erythropolis]|uniref:hypothetical protein n=1 Tax=Rhodococcus erythropolis TaxID=1833 RepID=UPI001BEB32A9|nr:hypothetical protein [Rhodococcus erythropolis]MBT2269054.1 hypothetical protein [Rhodococcus erythropolis]